MRVAVAGLAADAKVPRAVIHAEVGAALTLDAGNEAASVDSAPTSGQKDPLLVEATMACKSIELLVTSF